MVVGSDTMLFIDANKIGKPDSIADAKRMLRLLSGKTHRIFTSVAILDGLGGPGLNTVEQVSVKMRDYSEKEIERYLSCNESLDKAGAYSIQGAGRGLIESIRGDYLTAVGLPLRAIANYLRSSGVQALTNVDKLYSDKSFLNWKTFS
jgi:septum formation protein